MQHTATEVIKYRDDPSEAHMKQQVWSSLEPMFLLHGVLSQQRLLESKQKALCPTVRVVSGVTERQEGVGITVSFFLLRQLQDLPHMLSCPVSL